MERISIINVIICLIFIICSVLMLTTYSSLSDSKTATGTIKIEVVKQLSVQIYCDNGTWSASKSTITGTYSEHIDKEGYYYLYFRYHKPLIYDLSESPIYDHGYLYGGTFAIKLIQVADCESSKYSTDTTGWDAYMGLNRQTLLYVGDTFSINDAIQALIDFLDGKDAPTGTYKSTEYCEDVVLCYATTLSYSTSPSKTGDIIKTYSGVQIAFVGTSNKT